MSDTKTPETDAIWDACATPFEALSKMRDFARTLESENTRLREQVASLERDRLRALNIAGEHLDQQQGNTRPTPDALRVAREALEPFANHYDGSLDNIGGGTLVSPQFPLQAFKDAKAAIALLAKEGV
jgi:hypothetical protein